MITEIKNYLGEARLSQIEDRLGGDVALSDALALTEIEVRRRLMSDGQAVVYGALRLLRRAGIRPSPEDTAAWAEATAAAMKPAKPSKRKGKRGGA